jgi:RimJ/RimL family protein N-acetyltransferase
MAEDVTTARDTVLRTDRLLLRRWQDRDRAPFAAMNADPEVMAYFPSTLDRAASDLIIDRAEAALEAEGSGLWAVERREDGRFMGFVGLARPSFKAPFTPCLEIGWRLARDMWGHGYATEGAVAVRDHAFEVVGLDALLSWTTVANMPSRRVMERIGMTHDSRDDFDHPNLPVGHPLRRHVLYRLSRERWAEVRSW